MTGLATLLKDGKNVLVKSRSLYKQQDRQECHAPNVSRNIPLLAEEGAEREPGRAKPQEKRRRAKRRRRRGGAEARAR